MSYTEQSGEFIFIWKIKNFGFNTVKLDEYLASPEFEAFSGTKWYLRFYPRGHSNSVGNSLCYLYRVTCGAEKIQITFKIGLIGKDGNSLESDFRPNQIFSKENTYHIGWKWNKYLDDTGNSNLGTITIRCVMSRLESEIGYTTKCKAQTKIGIDQYSFRWNVKMFNESSWTDSKIFPRFEVKHIEVTLTAPSDIVKVSVKKVGSENSSQIITCKLSLLDVKGIEHDSNTYTHFFTSDIAKNTWSFDSFITKNKLLGEENKYIKYGFFTLMFEFSVSNENILKGIKGYFPKSSVGNVACAEVDDTITVLQEDLRRIYTKHWQTDINLCAENQTFRSHKLLLSARSPVFAIMFEQDMLENQTGVVDIPDVEAKILDCFLKFVYTGVVDNIN